MARLGDFVKIHTGKLDANASSPNGKYPFFTCAVEPLKIDSYSYDCECVLLAGNGDLNVKYYNGKFDAYQRTYVIESLDKEKLLVPYLYYFMERYVETLRRESIGGVIKYIKLGNITEAEINVPDLDSQTAVIERLRKLDKLFQFRKRQLAKLDELVKARFVELFGNLTNGTNGNSLPIYKLGELCQIGSGKRIYQQEQTTEGIPFLRVSDLVAKIEGKVISPSLFISSNQFQDLKEKNLVPLSGDILVTSRGTIGKCYIVQENDEFYFQDGMISWLYHFSDSVMSPYIAYLFSTSGFQKQVQKLQAGSTVAYLSIAMLNKLNVPLPPLNLQSRFVAFMRQSDKSRLTIRQGLDKMETLKWALMQKYFG